MSDQLAFPLDDASSPPAQQGPADPPDQPARHRVAVDLESTLFVEAGAGSGKTTALVERILSLVRARVPLETVAAITFTEKAAAELRQRVRYKLEEAIQASPDELLLRALDELDAAPISTLHAFAQRTLFEHPIEAGLPPGVEVLDELASQVDFDERWDNYLPDLLADDTMAAPLLVGDVLGIGPHELRSLAQQFENNWDLVAARLDTDPPALEVDVTGVVAALRDVARGAEECIDGDDALARLLMDAGAHAEALHAASGAADIDPIDRLVDLAELLSATSVKFGTADGPYKSKGNKKNWPDPDRFAALKVELHEAGQRRAEVLGSLSTSVILHLAAAIGGFVLEAAAQRRREGRLRFHDLLVLARETMRDPTVGPGVRKALGERYQRLLIDEFQDTDPIQVDLAVLIAAAVDPTDTPWQHIACGPGRLFFVGDPKQSIYRFRRADIATYLEAQEVFGGTQGQVRLSTNFRSTKPVIDWVNRVFEQLIVHTDGSQPHYAALDGVRPAPTVGPGVVALGGEGHEAKLNAAELRRLEAADVVTAIATAVNDSWTVGDTDEEGAAIERPARLGDITVLLPARTSLPTLEQALESAGIPYRAETASLVYATQEVRDLLMVARAADDPTDELAVVSALRTSAFGCGDDDLYLYRRQRGATWNHQRLGDAPTDGIVPEGLRWLAALHAERTWMAPAQILDRIVRDRRLLQLGVCAQRHREVWRRLRFVIDQARAWTDATGGDLRDYLGWVAMQASDSARVAETVLPETDTDAVRIMTVHASKGLEFPITILSGLTTRHQTRRAGVHVTWPPDGTIGYRLGAKNATPEYEAFVPLDEQMDEHERLRLLYVACTRARDHLVVSMHRCLEDTKPTSLAHVLAGVQAQRALPTLAARSVRAAERTAAAPRPPLPPHEAWSTERAEAFRTSERSRTIAATTLARLAAERKDDPGLQKTGRDLDLPPWQKGRYGTAVGRAVHGVLQTIDLRTGANLAALAAAQAAAEGVLGREADIEALTQAALDSATVREAAGASHWREIFVAAPVGERLLEGYVDLLYRTDRGLVVVDHKTDAWRDDEELDAKVERYRIQTAAYALAIEAASGDRVAEAVLLFLAEDGATARTITDLDEAKAEVVAITPGVVAGGEASTGD